MNTHFPKIALISYNLTAPLTDYIILGEIFDRDIIRHSLKEIFNELYCLCPFVFDADTLKCDNEEDIEYIRKKYKLTSVVKMIGKKYSGTYRSPMLYNLSDKEFVYNQKFRFDSVLDYKKENTVIVFPYTNPNQRRIILDDILLYNPLNIFLFGDIQGKNSVSTATLMARYLKKINYDGQVTKIQTTPTESVLYNILLNSDGKVIFACSSVDINYLLDYTKRIKQNVGVKILFCCPFV